MSATKDRPFTLQSLARFLDLPGDRESAGFHKPGLAALLEERCQISRQWTHRRWQLGLDAWEADRLACALGRHPLEIWPTWFQDSLAFADAYEERIRQGLSRVVQPGRYLIERRAPLMSIKITKVQAQPKSRRPTAEEARQQREREATAIAGAVERVRAERMRNLPPETVAVYRKFELFGFDQSSEEAETVTLTVKPADLGYSPRGHVPSTPVEIEDARCRLRQICDATRFIPESVGY